MAPKDKEAVEITAETPKQENKNTKKEDLIAEENLSEEDKELKERLETCVSTVLDSSAGVPIQMKALDMIVTELRTATSSMTSVPKPLKFLRPHFASLKQYYESLQKELELRARLADVLAVLAMTMGQHEGTLEAICCLVRKLTTSLIMSLLLY